MFLALDDSGSMSGQACQDLMAAVQQFIMKRLEYYQQAGTPCGDLITILNYSCSTQVSVNAQSLTSTVANSVPFRGGGTDFSVAMNKTHELLRKCGTERNLALMFMSDGGCSNGEKEIQLSFLVENFFIEQMPRNQRKEPRNTKTNLTTSELEKLEELVQDLNTQLDLQRQARTSHAVLFRRDCDIT